MLNDLGSMYCNGDCLHSKLPRITYRIPQWLIGHTIAWCHRKSVWKERYGKHRLMHLFYNSSSNSTVINAVHWFYKKGIHACVYFCIVGPWGLAMHSSGTGGITTPLENYMFLVTVFLDVASSLARLIIRAFDERFITVGFTL